MTTGRLLHWSYQPRNEHSFSVLKLNLPDESRAHASGPRMACNNRPGRDIDDIEVDARVFGRWWNPSDLSSLGDFTAEHLIIRHND